jgi:uncharacterized protein (DUF305 family)
MTQDIAPADASAGSSTGARPAGPGPSTRRQLLVVGMALALVVAACAGLFIGNRLAGGHPADDSVDAGFARDMQIHHGQAVEMSYAVTLVTDDQSVRTMAYDVMTSQQGQIGRMSGWLDSWDLPAYSPAPLMEWMGGVDAGEGHEGHEGHEAGGNDGALMPGMATDAELEQLRQSSGLDAEILFLQLMVEHHRGGVDMASYAAEHAGEDEVRLAAERMASSQAVEIDAMNDMLVERGADPV